MRQPGRGARSSVLLLAVLVVLLVGCAGSRSPESGSDARGTSGGEASSSGSEDDFGPRSGGRLPDLTLEALSDRPALELGSLRGPVVVNVWASWCRPCRDELPIYEEFARAHGDAVRVVGITSEDTSEDAARDLVAETGVTYPNYTDPDGGLRAIALPQVVLLDAAGEVAFEQYLEITSVAQLEDLAREHLGTDL